MAGARFNADSPGGRHILAQEAIKRGEMAAAEGHDRMALRFDPCASPVRVSLAALLLEARRGGDAVALLVEGTRLTPADAYGHYALGLAYAEVGRKRDAVRALEEAARLAPQDAQAAYALGISYMQAGQAPEASRALREALRLEPSHDQARRALAQLERR